jgi:hypothetical protein
MRFAIMQVGAPFPFASGKSGRAGRPSASTLDND